MSNLLKYNITKDGKVQHLTTTDLNDCRVQLMALMKKEISNQQARKVTQLFVGHSTTLHGYRISCRSKNPSFKQMREDG